MLTEEQKKEIKKLAKTYLVSEVVRIMQAKYPALTYKEIQYWADPEKARKRSNGYYKVHYEKMKKDPKKYNEWLSYQLDYQRNQRKRNKNGSNKH